MLLYGCYIYGVLELSFTHLQAKSSLIFHSYRIRLFRICVVIENIQRKT